MIAATGHTGFADADDERLRETGIETTRGGQGDPLDRPFLENLPETGALGCQGERTLHTPLLAELQRRQVIFRLHPDLIPQLMPAWTPEKDTERHAAF